MSEVVDILARAQHLQEQARRRPAGRVHAAGASSRYDDRRNSSRVFPVTAGAGRQAAAELAKHADEDWYRWTVAYGQQQHLHGSKRLDGTPAACPVRGCPILGAEAERLLAGWADVCGERDSLTWVRQRCSAVAPSTTPEGRASDG